MSFKQIYFFVEGYYDKLFIERVVKPILENSYQDVGIWEIAGKRTEQVVNFIRSLESMGADYFILKDINSSPCITASKEKIQIRYSQTSILNKLIIVIKEIESWYLGGLTEIGYQALNISPVDDTNHLTKEIFDSMRPKQIGSRLDFLQQILTHYSIDTAKSKNDSFGYFINRLSPWMTTK